MKTITGTTLRKDAHHLADDFHDLAQHAGNLAAHSARLAKQNLVRPGQQLSRDAADRVRSAAHRGLDLAETEFSRCLSAARSNPLITALAIGIAGIVLGLAVGTAARRPSSGCQSHQDPDNPERN